MSNQLSVALLPSLMLPRTKPIGCAVVIDVLRATSVMTTAASVGARSVMTCSRIEEARQLAAARPESTLLCGERACVPIEGFHLGNSPAEYVPSVVADRDVVLTTTNGTKAIAAVNDATRLVVASFLNLGFTVDSIGHETDVQVVCAGTESQLSYEDVLLAGAIVDRYLAKHPRTAIDDSARLAWSAWQQTDESRESIARGLRLSLGGRNLLAAGYEADLDRCAAIDTRDGIVEKVTADDIAPSLTRFAWKT